MVEFLRDVGQQADSVWMLATQVALLAAATLVLNFVLMRVSDLLARQVAKSRNIWDDVLIEALRVPVRLAFWLLALSIAVTLIRSMLDWSVFDAVPVIREVLVVAILVFFAMRFFRVLEEALVDPARREEPMDYTTASAITKVLRAIVLVLAGMMILQTLGFSMTGIAAFGGMGGIAVGFAAKDVLANFFGGLMVHLDHPFRVGDWVRSPDQDIEGVVEEIGWRLTTIRTFDKRPLYVPNATFSTVSLENPSRMFNRRIYEKLGIRYQDWKKMRAIVNAVRSQLEEHDEIDKNQTMIVNFNTYEDSHLEFFIYTFTKTVDWVKFHQIKQEILLGIMEIIEQHGAEVAFPTRTLHMRREQPGDEGASMARASGDPTGRETAFPHEPAAPTPGEGE
jgi:MscS family membrane protein